MRIRTIIIAAAAAASVTAASWAGGDLHLPASFPAAGAAAVTGHRAGLATISDPRRVTYSAHIRRCHTRDHGQLPDRACTPGSIDPAVTQANIGSTICREGWTKTIRPPEAQTERAKYDVAYPAYGIRGHPPSELDHEVALELGGSNDITNLWPELGPVPNPKDRVENTLSSLRSRSTSKSAGQNVADASVTNIKDVLERRLNLLVCRGKVSLADAQTAIARNWITAYERWVGPLS